MKPRDIDRLNRIEAYCIERWGNNLQDWKTKSKGYVFWDKMQKICALMITEYWCRLGDNPGTKEVPFSGEYYG